MDDTPEESIETREVSVTKNDARKLSSQILEIIDLKGKVTEPGPGAGPCGEKDFDKYYTVDHPWSLYEAPVPDMQKAMERLKSELPKKGWKVTSYGPDSSRAKSLELIAHSDAPKFSVSITLLDRRGRSENPSMISVTLTSACFKVPEGKSVAG